MKIMKNISSHYLPSLNIVSTYPGRLMKGNVAFAASYYIDLFKEELKMAA